MRDKMMEKQERIRQGKPIRMEDIPSIALYMDQVIQLFEQNYHSYKRNEDEKILTKTMINNYAKGKLLPPIKNKRYSKEHILTMSLIYQLKGILSIQDIKSTLESLNEEVQKEEVNIEDVYDMYIDMINENEEQFNENVDWMEKSMAQNYNEKISQPNNEMKEVLMINSLVHMSNLYRRLAEAKIDSLSREENRK